jgi:hypothetical protein
MKVVAKRGDSLFLVADNPQNNQSPGKMVNTETKECWPTENIQIPIKFGYWEEVNLAEDDKLNQEILTICNTQPKGLEKLFDFMQK